MLCDLDKQVGDGDCGNAFNRGATGVLENIKEGKNRSPDHFINEMADSIRTSVGGSSGICYDLGLRAAANSIENDPEWKGTNSEELNHRVIVRALKAGIDAISTIGGANQGDRTMLDALYPCV